MRFEDVKTFAAAVPLFLAGLLTAWMIDCAPAHAAVIGQPSGCGQAMVCGLNAPEDLVSVGHGHGVIASRLGGGGIDFIDVKTRRVSSIDLGAMPRAPDPAYPCSGFDAAAPFYSHGLSVKSDAAGNQRLYVVRHGAREAIEIFKFAKPGNVSSLQWIGCVLLPKGFEGNAVTGRRDGGFYVTSMVDAGDAALASKLAELYAKRRSGAVLNWTPNIGFRQQPTGPISGPNGVELSPNERWLYVAGWASGGIWAFDLNRPGSPARRLGVDFMPDNLRWADDGSLLAAGMRAEPGPTFDCAMNAQPSQRCATRWTVLSIDAARMSRRYEIRVDDTSGFGDVSVALTVGRDLWLGSFGGDTVAIVPNAKRKAS